MFSRYILWQIYSNLFNLDSGVFNLVFDLHRPNQRYFFFTYRPTNFHVITTITAIVKIETLSVRSLSQRSLRPLNGNFHMSAIISKLIFFFFSDRIDDMETSVRVLLFLAMIYCSLFLDRFPYDIPVS